MGVEGGIKGRGNVKYPQKGRWEISLQGDQVIPTITCAALGLKKLQKAKISGPSSSTVFSQIMCKELSFLGAVKEVPQKCLVMELFQEMPGYIK